MVLIKSILAGLAGIAVVAAQSSVLDLIPSNFDEIAIGGKPALVEFFAPWCGHCKTLAPIYEELATAFSGSKSKVVIAKVDADREKTLGKRFGVQGFPTLKWFDGKSDKPEDYNGGRDLESLSAFITKKTGVHPKKAKAVPSSVEMLTDTTFKTQIGGDKDVIVAFTAPWCGHCKTLAPIWETVATDFANEPSVLIAKVDAEAENAKATAQDQGVKSYPTIKFFPKGSKVAEPYEGGRTEQDIVSFLNEKAGTHRAVGGGLNAKAGLIDALDALVEKFTVGSTITEVLAESSKFVEDTKNAGQVAYAKYYVKVFSKQTEDGGWAAKELARLDRILKQGGLAPTKLDEFTSKSNILRRFVWEKVVGEKVVEEKVVPGNHEL